MSGAGTPKSRAWGWSAVYGGKHGEPIDGRRERQDRYHSAVRAGDIVPSDYLDDDGNPLPQWREAVARIRAARRL